jgi:hypothetical protein
MSLADTKAQLLFNATFVIESDLTPEIDSTQRTQWQQHFLLQRPTRKSEDPSLLSFIHYFGMDCDAPNDQPLCFALGKDIRDIDVQLDTPAESSIMATVTVTGFSSLSGWFSLTYSATDLANDPDSSSQLQISYYGPKAKRKKGGSGIPLTIDKIHKAKDFLRAQRTSRKPKPLPPSSDQGILFNEDGNLPNLVESNAVGVFVQFLSTAPLELQVEFRSNLQWGSREDVQSAVAEESREPVQDFPARVQALVAAFDAQFEVRFRLGASAAAFSEQQVEVARRALSGLLGGLGHFHGAPVTGDSLAYVAPDPEEEEGGEEEAAAPNVLTLFTATPSRSSFPRGFLWDEVSWLSRVACCAKQGRVVI